MPHQCVRCNKFYDDADKVILNGCSCGAKLFFYIRKEKLKKLKEEKSIELSQDQRIKIEKDIYNLLGHEKSEPVVLDIESVRINSPGKYELDIVNLFRGEPVVFKLEEGKYMIDLPETFRRLPKK